MDEQTAFIDLAANGEIMPPMPRNGDGTALGPTLTEYDLFVTEGALQPLLEKVKGYVADFAGADVSTETGRAFMRTFAFKIVKTRTLIESRGKAIADRQKQIPKLIDGARRYAKTYLENLEEEFRKPLNDWEATEKTRRDKHLAAIEAIHGAGSGYVQPTAEDLRQHIARLESTIYDAEQCEEFLEEYEIARKSRVVFLGERLTEREKWEADQAELVELRRIKAERDAAEAEKLRESEAAERAEWQKAEDERLAKSAEEAAQRRAQELADEKLRERLKAEVTEKAAEERRQSNKRHRAKVNNEAMQAIVKKLLFTESVTMLGTESAEAFAKAVVVAIAQCEIPHVRMEY